MRVFLAALGVFVLSIAFWGCGGIEPNTPEPPSSPVITFGDDEYEVVLSWLPSPSVIDGYRISFNGELLAELPSSQTEYSHYPPTLGTYELIAFKDRAESARRHVELPGAWRDSTSLAPKVFSGFRFDTRPAWSLRYGVYSMGQYGTPENEYLADSIDFFVDTTYTLHSPYRIVELGNWTHAFKTKFKLIARGVTSAVLDTLTLIPQYSGSYLDSVKVETGDLVAVVAFRDNPTVASSDKIYAVLFVALVDEEAERLHFIHKFQTAPNFRLIREAD